MDKQWLMIKQLDRQLNEWQVVKNKYGQPRAGWVKTLRTALSMSTEQLANRLGFTRSRITQLENAEIHDAVTLRTLKEVADAMECEFIYAIVPKQNLSLEKIIYKRAEAIAKERVARVAHSMSLEAQDVEAEMLKNQKEDLVRNLTEHLNKKFWVTLEPHKKGKAPKSLADKIYIEMQKETLPQKDIKTLTDDLRKLLDQIEKDTNNRKSELNKETLRKKILNLLQKKK